MPKEEIQGLSFISQNPKYNGKDIIIAIFDTGVDPGAAGLQSCPDGRPKIVDTVDCTGSGDISTSTKVTATVTTDPTTNTSVSTITAAGTGRKLVLNPDWKNPSGEWRVGYKAAYDLFPGGLQSRLKKQRKLKWVEKHRVALTAATAALAEHKAKYPTSNSLTSDNGNDGGGDKKKKEREELEARVKLLQDDFGPEKYQDNGPILECVVWNDGSTWLASIDTSDMYDDSGDECTAASTTKNTKKEGLLADFTPMTNFRTQRQWATFSPQDSCNFAVNIYNDGDILSIVVDAGAHGTHVAGICAAHHADDPQLNGVAPGAQIISCKIGDTRLGSMETGVGLMRALATVLENKADVINMSYGEATSTPNMGRFISLAEEIVYEHNVVYVSSAGNAGPALSTVGAPGGSSSCILGIGAYVSPALAKAGHSVRSTEEHIGETGGQQYTWSSRGPTADGDVGVCFSAPGGAIAPVPQWTSQKRQLMNGTSMSSPCAAGGVALLLSAMKAEGQKVTPARVRRAIENTCRAVNAENPASALTYGRGLLQVGEAWEYLKKSAEVDVPAELRYDVSVKRADGTAKGRGIYLRQPWESTVPCTYSCEIKPGLREDADIKTEKMAIEAKIALKISYNNSGGGPANGTGTVGGQKYDDEWVKAPSLLLLPHNGRTFEVEINPTALPPGLHYAEIVGVDTTAEWRGALFRIPITITKPLVMSNPDVTAGMMDLGRFEFVPGKEQRRFVAVPEGATWAELKMNYPLNDNNSTTTVTSGQHIPKSYMVRATQLAPQTRYSDTEHRSFVQLTPGSDHIASLAVLPGTTLEVTLAQFWSSLGDSALDVELTFHGVQLSSNGGGGGALASSIALDGSSGAKKLMVRALFSREKVKPTAKLTKVRLSLRPNGNTAELSPLNTPRDQLPRNQTIHKLILTYKLTVSEGGSKWAFILPPLNRFVYDAVVEAQMVMVFDSNKQLLGVGDIYPLDNVELKKGEYTVRVLLRHDDPSVLDKMKALPLLAERTLGTAVTVPVYGMHADSVMGKNAVTKEKTLCRGEMAAFFVGPVVDDNVPKDAMSGGGGVALVGSLSFGQLSAAAKGSKSNGNGDAPGGVELVYIPPTKKIEPTPTTSSDKEGGSGDKDKKEQPSPEESLDTALRDAKVKYLQGMKLENDKGDDEEASKALYNKILSEMKEVYPKHLPLLLEPLKRQQQVAAGMKITGESEKDDDGKDGGKDDKKMKKKMETLHKVVQAADEVIGAIDTAELAIFLAQKCPEEGPDAVARKKEMDERKSAIVDALYGKCTALLDLAEGENSSNNATDTASISPEFEAAFSELRKWVDPAAEAKHATLLSKREAAAGRFANALKALDKTASPEDKPTPKEVVEARSKLFEQLGWLHLERGERRRLLKAFPSSFPLF
jgi:tripeptidyl-peptidase-2